MLKVVIIYRPILACYDSFTYKCAVWLSGILTPFRELLSNIRDTFDFILHVLHSQPDPGHMAFFYVENLFANSLVSWSLLFPYRQDKNNIGLHEKREGATKR